MTPQSWRRIRQAVQILAALLFAYLLLGTRQGLPTFLPHDLFFRLDPLVGAAAMLASRRWIPALALGLATIALAVVTGRAWCGWLCPLGAVLDWMCPRKPAAQDDPRGNWRTAKHALLLVILSAALLGNLTLLILDPLTILFRTMTAAVLPAVNALLIAAESALYAIGPLQRPLEWADGILRGAGLVGGEPAFQQGIVLALLFGAIVALNAVRPRFWCRYLCPLGALLGLVSKVALVRHRVDADTCIACGKCARACPTGTIDPARGYAADPAECTLCLDCAAVCPTNAVGFHGHLVPAAWRDYDPSRRQALLALGAAVAGVGLLRAAPAARRESPWLIRPPGARENGLLDKCVRCGECMKVCPTSGLQPSLFAAGLEGLWTPVLVPRLGYCDYSCHSCGQACPTGAIPLLSLDDKRRAVLGVAYIDENRCIPWADGVDCIVCEEMCPVPEKAIQLDVQTVTRPDGTVAEVRRPRVVRERCIGCGICEYKCPLNGEAAIRVRAA